MWGRRVNVPKEAIVSSHADLSKPEHVQTVKLSNGCVATVYRKTRRRFIHGWEGMKILRRFGGEKANAIELNCSFKNKFSSKRAAFVFDGTPTSEDLKLLEAVGNKILSS